MRGPEPGDNRIIAEFLDLYWNQRGPWTTTKWLGIGIAKCPLDLFVYQEILFETRPELLIEAGTCIGGSAMFFASVFDMIGTGQVVTVDKDAYPHSPKHQRITYITGDSVSPGIVETVRAAAQGKRTMVVLDSLHTYEHVSRELAAYGDLVTPGCYLVVEDTTVDGSWRMPAARRAAAEFVASNPGFFIDRSREYQLITFNPDGWIKRVQ